MTRIVRICLTLEVPDDVEIQINRDEEEEEGPPLFEGLPEGPIAPPMSAPPELVMSGNPMAPHPLSGNPICPRHKKSREGKGGWYCPTVISAPGVEPKIWCDWRVKVA